MAYIFIFGTLAYLALAGGPGNSDAKIRSFINAGHFDMNMEENANKMISAVEWNGFTAVAEHDPTYADTAKQINGGFSLSLALHVARNTLAQLEPWDRQEYAISRLEEEKKKEYWASFGSWLDPVVSGQICWLQDSLTRRSVTPWMASSSIEIAQGLSFLRSLQLYLEPRRSQQLTLAGDRVSISTAVLKSGVDFLKGTMVRSRLPRIENVEKGIKALRKWLKSLNSRKTRKSPTTSVISVWDLEDFGSLPLEARLVSLGVQASLSGIQLATGKIIHKTDCGDKTWIEGEGGFTTQLMLSRRMAPFFTTLAMPQRRDLNAGEVAGIQVEYATVKENVGPPADGE